MKIAGKCNAGHTLCCILKTIYSLAAVRSIFMINYEAPILQITNGHYNNF